MKKESIHRDDIDADLMAQIEQEFSELYPGYKVVCAGDVPDGNGPETSAIFAALEKQSQASLANGTCLDCGAQMSNYHPERDGWEPAEGWGTFHEIGTEEIMGWQCPKCDSE